MRAVRGRRVILISAAVLLVTLVLAAGMGAVRIAPYEAFRILLSRVPGLRITADWQETNAVIFWDIRLPRVLLGALAGLALSLAGGAYQGLFKNPLADPSVLGVSAGAALGGATAIAFLGHLQMRGVGTVPFFAFLGGLAAVTTVYRLAVVGRRVPVIGLLLAGVAVGSFGISLVSLILYVTNQQARDAIVFWMMGGLGGANWQKVGWLLPYIAVGVGFLLLHWRELNALLLGEESALHLGVDVEYLKRVVLVAGTLLTAASVAFAGTIGFVGLVVPHLVRFLVGPDHRYLLPASGVVGAIVLVLADTIARSLLPTEIPVGLVMAVLGGPFFLWLLRRKLQPADL
ncbi:MAG TPA: iron ABC transporter permease [Symbiobacteriaceae bacterium]|nr:iron ABC transporter permease [Symbiobacteriaceae bacterium]